MKTLILHMRHLTPAETIEKLRAAIQEAAGPGFRVVVIPADVQSVQLV